MLSKRDGGVLKEQVYKSKNEKCLNQTGLIFPCHLTPWRHRWWSQVLWPRGRAYSNKDLEAVWPEMVLAVAFYKTWWAPPPQGWPPPRQGRAPTPPAPLKHTTVQRSCWTVGSSGLRTKWNNPTKFYPSIKLIKAMHALGQNPFWQQVPMCTGVQPIMK